MKVPIHPGGNSVARTKSEKSPHTAARRGPVTRAKGKGQSTAAVGFGGRRLVTLGNGWQKLLHQHSCQKHSQHSTLLSSTLLSTLLSSIKNSRHSLPDNHNKSRSRCNTVRCNVALSLQYCITRPISTQQVSCFEGEVISPTGLYVGIVDLVSPAVERRSSPPAGRSAAAKVGEAVTEGIRVTATPRQAAAGAPLKSLG